MTKKLSIFFPVLFIYVSRYPDLYLKNTLPFGRLLLFLRNWGFGRALECHWNFYVPWLGHGRDNLAKSELKPKQSPVKSEANSTKRQWKTIEGIEIISPSVPKNETTLYEKKKQENALGLEQV